MLRGLKRLAVTCLAACVVALAGPAGPASAQDDCGGAAYCLPAPPATDAVKARGAKQAKRSLHVDVTLSAQVGSALVYAPRGGILTPRPTRRKRVRVPAVSIHCPSKCTATGALRLKVGRRTLGRARVQASLREGAGTATRITLSRKDLRRIVRAGEGTLTANVKIADLYGSHEQTLAVEVHPAPLV
jgi:hypothetical protein